MGPWKKILVFFLAFSILNQSIDFDYITYGFGSNHRAADYDDIDSILELLVENLIGDEHFTADDNDDSGVAQHKGLEKQSYSFNCQEAEKIKPSLSRKYLTPWFAGIDHSNKVCKGYTKIIAPPPKATS